MRLGAGGIISINEMKLHLRIKAFLVTLLGFVLGVFMWAGVITAGTLFVLGLIADVKDVMHRMLLAIVISVVCGINIWSRYNFVGRYHGRLQGHDVEWGLSEHNQTKECAGEQK